MKRGKPLRGSREIPRASQPSGILIYPQTSTEPPHRSPEHPQSSPGLSRAPQSLPRYSQGSPDLLRDPQGSPDLSRAPPSRDYLATNYSYHTRPRKNSKTTRHKTLRGSRALLAACQSLWYICILPTKARQSLPRDPKVSSPDTPRPHERSPEPPRPLVYEYLAPESSTESPQSSPGLPRAHQTSPKLPARHLSLTSPDFPEAPQPRTPQTSPKLPEAPHSLPRALQVVPRAPRTSPERPSDPQSLPRDPQGSPELPRLLERFPKLPRASPGVPMFPRPAQSSPNLPRRSQSSKKLLREADRQLTVFELLLHLTANQRTADQHSLARWQLCTR